MQPTPYSKINTLLEKLLSYQQKILGNKLVGLYLYGSLVWGDFDEKSSDIDLLAIVSVDVNEEEFKQLKRMHDKFANKHPEWDNRIEVQYLSSLALKTFKSKVSKAAVISPGEPFHMIEVGDHWLINWYIVREKGIALFGPSPKTVIETISKDEFIQSVRKHTQSWDEWVKNMKNKKAQAYAILTLCRALYAVENGEQPSKKQAALWTKKQLPEWSGMIDKALLWKDTKKGYQEDEEYYSKTVEFVHDVRNRILKK